MNVQEDPVEIFRACIPENFGASYTQGVCVLCTPG